MRYADQRRKSRDKKDGKAATNEKPAFGLQNWV
jgi:hypothetical protein